MKKVILLATSHDIQRGERLNPKYIDYVENLIKKYDIKSISEEIKDDVKYITEKFCDEKVILHKIIEPNDAVEKAELGIRTLNEIKYYFEQRYIIEEFPCEAPRLSSWPDEPSRDNLPLDIFKEYYEMFQKASREREKIWLKRIVELDTYPSLVIFGASHLDEFSKLLESNGIEIVHQEKFGVDE